MSVAPTTTNVPEYHDCQRLIQKNRTYGPLVAVFAWDKLELLSDSLAKLQGKPERALAAAEVWNVNRTTTYSPLLLRPGFSCLYMYKDAARWRAKLVYKGWPEPKCNIPVDPNAISGLDLEVRPIPTTSTDFTVDDVIPAARWEWDPVNSGYYFGLKCEPTRWCEIGLPTFKSSTKYSVNPAWPKASRHNREIKGWYDEQRLARPDGAGNLVPSIVGTVLPVADLKTRTATDYTGKWSKVANVSLSEASSFYQSKFNFVKPVGNDSTTVWICRGNSCPEIRPEFKCDIHPDDTVPWWAKITAPGRKPIYKCVEYWSNPGGALAPGSVRWRFISNDDTIWVTCPHGCCQVKPGGV